MFQEMCTVMGHMIASIAGGSNAEETVNETTNDVSNPEKDLSEHNKLETEETLSEPQQEETLILPERGETNSSEAEFSAAALQVPAITTDGDADGREEAQQSSSLAENTAHHNAAQKSASTSPPPTQDLRWGESLPDSMPLASRDGDSSLRSSLGIHAGYYGRTSSFTPPSSSHHHRRTSSNTEVSYAMMSVATADQLHASWTNTSSDPDDPLSFLSTAGFSHDMDNSLGNSRPLSISRISSNASAVSATSGPVLVASSSFVSEDNYHNGVSSAIHDAARITDWETVKDLCAQDPEAAKFVGKDRWTALHHACNRRCPDIEAFRALLQAYPDALLLKEEKGWYPLHYACRFKAPEDAVRLLLYMFPEKGKLAVKKADRQGRTPLYYAVRYDAPPGVVETLLKVDASVVLEEDQSGDSPLGLVWDAWAEKLEGKRTLQRIHGTSAEGETLEERAARVKRRLQSQSKVLARWNTVNTFLKATFGFSVDDGEAGASAELEGEEKEDSPSSVSGGRKWRILHATASIKCHTSLFQLACALHPEQAKELDEGDLQGPSNLPGGWQSAKHLTALHLAASSQANGDAGRMILQKLLQLNAAAAEAKDSLGNLPLHRIVENKAKTHWTRDGAKGIYDAYPDAVRALDFDGRLPLHGATTAMVAQGDATAETTTLRSTLCSLLELYPDGAAHADNFGRLPIHLAAEHGTAWDIQLQLLHDQFPQGVRSRTGVKLGNVLPLHLAASNPSAEPSLIKKLVELHPRASSQANRGGKLPLHFACETGLCWESVQCIHEANPGAIRHAEQNCRGWNALQMAAACKRANRELVANLLGLYPEAAQVADTRGRYALHLACISGKSWAGGLSDLFDGNPEAISSSDRMGLLPFYMAAFRYCGSPQPGETVKPAVTDKAKKHHRRHSSRMSIEVIQREQAREAEAARQTDILFNLLKADPTVLQL